MRIQADIPEAISPDELDARLALGWWRLSSLMLRTSLVHIGAVIHEVVHLRARIDAPPRSRSARRLLRRNRARFTCHVGPAKIDADRRRLYRLTRPRFLGPTVDDLEEVALSNNREAFDTREVAVYDGDQLVAVSYFDLGERSLAGILALYDPDYSRHSLGRYTMLEEIEWARARGCHFYYPGYVVPGVPAFDYKLGLERLERMVPSGAWRGLEGAPPATNLVAQLEGRLDALVSRLEAHGLEPQARVYPSFWLGRWPEAKRRFLGGLRHLQCAVREETKLVSNFLAKELLFDKALEGDGGQLRQRYTLIVDHLMDLDLFVVGWARPLIEADAFEGVSMEPELARLYERSVMYFRGPRRMTSSVDEALRMTLEALAEGPG